MINKTKKLDPDDKKLEAAILIRQSLLGYLKANKAGYQEVADKIGISLSSFKRLLDHCDFSLKQISLIAAYMNMSLKELLETSAKTQVQFHEFTADQEEFFAKNPRAFYSLTKIMKGSSVLDLSKELKLRSHEIEMLLYQLDKINIIRLLPRGRFKMVSMGPFRWRKDGALEKSYYKKFCQAVHDSMPEAFVKHKFQNDLTPLFRPFEFYLQTSTFIEFKKDVSDLILKYHIRAIAESDQIHAKDLVAASGAFSLQNVDVLRKVLCNNEGQDE